VPELCQQLPVAGQGGEHGARRGRVGFARHQPGHEAGQPELLGIHREPADQEFVQHHAETVDIGASVHVESGHLSLLRTHVGRRPHRLAELGYQGLLGEPLAGGLGDAEVDDLGDRMAVGLGDQDVGRLEVAVNHPLLVGVLDGATDRDEQGDAVTGGELGRVAVLGDGNPAD
jgi:hypothetical protein